MLEIPMFWLGRLGDLHPLACPEPGISVPIIGQMASNVSVSAAETRDLQGFRRQWELEEAYMDSDDVMLFEAMYLGVIHPPLRIIDPLKKNRLRAAVSAATKQSYLPGGVDTFSAPIPGIVQNLVDEPDRPAVEFITDGDQREISFTPTNSVSWVASANGTMMYPNGAPKETTPDVIHRPSMVDPVLPGETITITFTTRVVTGAAEFGIYLVSSDMSSVEGDVVSIATGSYDTYSITYTAPTDGSVIGIAPFFRTTTADTTRVNIAYGQLEVGEEYTGWELGYGAPECMIIDMSAVSPRYPLVTAQITIKEL